MAEAVAGLFIAEQVISTGVTAAAAVAVAKPTPPLKASLRQISVSGPEDEASIALARCNHSATVIGDRLFLFGGEDAKKRLCSPDVHVVSLVSGGSSLRAEHTCYPATPLNEAPAGTVLVPPARAEHAAAASGKRLIVHGGRDGQSPLSQNLCLWALDTETARWSHLDAQMQLGKTLAPRFGHWIFSHDAQDALILHGGRLSADDRTASTETWQYTFSTNAWTQLPSAPAPATAAAFVDRTLYAVGGDDPLAGSIHYLRLDMSPADQERADGLAWQTVTFPRSALTPGPAPRIGAALVPVATGFGRKYLIYLLGSRPLDSDAEPYYSDLWSLQLPASRTTAAGVQDALRAHVPGAESEEFAWAEVEIVPSEQTALEGKVHPGPRAFFAAAECLSGRGVVLWGGENAHKKAESDGWIVQVQ